MARIYKRGETWWGCFEREGRKFRKSLGTGVKAIAQERLGQWINEAKGQQWGEKARYTFDEAAKRFADEHFKVVSKEGARRYFVSLMNLGRMFEGLHLDEITKPKLLEFEQKRRAEGVTTTTIRRDLACLSVMFSCAIDDWEWCEVNPVRSYLKARQRRGGLKEGAARTRYLSHEEERLVLKQAERHPMLWAALIVAIDTGLRDKEQLSLQWPHVNLDKAEVTVVGKGRKVRTVPLLARALDVLNGIPRHPRSKYVFWHHDGQKYLRLYRPFQTALKNAGVEPHVEWHDLRRTCGCRLLQDHQMPMERVSKWLGHSSISVTQKHYAFLHVEQLHASIAKPGDFERTQKRTQDAVSRVFSSMENLD